MSFQLSGRSLGSSILDYIMCYYKCTLRTPIRYTPMEDPQDTILLSINYQCLWQV